PAPRKRIRRMPNGLLYWGIGAAYDAQRERVSSPYENTTIGIGHSLKWHFPYYELMWEVNPSVTKQLIESLWSAHILDWSNLDMNRGSSFDSSLQKPWEYEYKPGPVYFHSKVPWGHAFIASGTNLSHAAAILHKLSGDREPLIWSKRLMHRYVETRDPNIGISASPYNQSKINRARYQFGDDFQGHIIFEGTLFPQDYIGWSNPMVRGLSVGYLNITPGVPYSVVVGPWTSQLLLGDSLGANGQKFTQWALEELTALGKIAYRREDNSFIPMLTDGTSLEGYVCKKDGYYGIKGTAFEPIRAVPMDFWAYALAYRITEDRFMWEVARNIGLGQDFGDIGISPTNEPELQKEALSSDPFVLLSFLELHKKTGNKAFLEMAEKIGDNILANRVQKGFFLASSRHIYAKFDVLEPLVLLHLHAAIKAGDKSAPIVWPNKSMYNGPYRYRHFATDYKMIYFLTESPEPPMSLEEVVAIGDVGEVKRLISQGFDVDERIDGYLRTPLHRAAYRQRRQCQR
ncbi:MAG: ankyrin repeat domain-containing protein, partial [Planctomycetota bacterium]